MAATKGMADLKRDYPVTSGLGADDKHEGRELNLVPERGSLYPSRFKKGFE